MLKRRVYRKLERNRREGRTPQSIYQLAQTTRIRREQYYMHLGGTKTIARVQGHLDALLAS